MYVLTYRNSCAVLLLHVVLSLGLIGVQTTVQAMVEVMWGFMEASPTNVTIVLPHLVEMLLSEVNITSSHNYVILCCYFYMCVDVCLLLLSTLPVSRALEGIHRRH